MATVNEDLITSGSYFDEQSAKSALLDSIELLNKEQKLFNIYEEVECHFLGAKPFANRDQGRIDLVLSPTKPLIDSGWENGFVGIEIKKSGHKAKDVLFQAADYSQSCFRMPASMGGFTGMFGIVCVFPEIKEGGSFLSSFLAQNRLAQCSIDSGFSISASGTTFFRKKREGLHVRKFMSGCKTGSR